MTCRGPGDPCDPFGPFDGCDERQWTLERIAATRLLIIKYEMAIDALSTGAQSYQLDTGQTRQLVSKANLGSMQLMLARLEARLGALQMRLGKARFQVRPGW